MKIIIDVKNEEEAQKIQDFLQDLSLSYHLESEHRPLGEKSSAKLLEFLRSNPVEDDISDRISDPVKWQRSIRKDRKLPFRP